MRILFIHNFYQHPGGEDVVFEQEKALLSTTEDVFSLTFKNKKGWRGAWQTFWSPWNLWAAMQVKRAIRRHQPDIIHIHNLHYAVGPVAVRIAKRLGVPVVMTLHNYRLLCPSATLYHDGGIFTASLHVDFPWEAVRKGVHSRSVVKTGWLAFTTWLHRKMGTWRMVDRYITLTEFAKQLFVNSSFGIAAEKFVTKPNFVADSPKTTGPRGQHFLFIGRLAEEKGMNVLLDAFKGTDYSLRIAGDGPLKDRVIETTRISPNITYLGSLGRSAISQQLAECSALLFPSIWYEGLPMTLIEAFAAGTPVIASDLGAMQSLVNEGITGWRFAPNDAAALRRRVAEWLRTDDEYKAQIGRQAREEYQRHYTAEQNKKQLLTCYHAMKGAAL
ncbi:glycosyltransferase family 4 protein [Parapedobacter sp. 2B3]|uniref:glycosyltransferase family 4 protein n=1 Tax=Parapedobacter sp. 2B3 TaxID=3342381 RepID=UPI0035B5F1FE